MMAELWGVVTEEGDVCEDATGIRLQKRVGLVKKGNESCNCGAQLPQGVICQWQAVIYLLPRACKQEQYIELHERALHPQHSSLDSQHMLQSLPLTVSFTGDPR